jgi:hypothetical protein
MNGLDDEDDGDDEDDADEKDDEVGRQRYLTIVKMGLRRAMCLSDSEYA